MSSFLTSLGSIANQYGEAKNSATAEKEARTQKLRQMDVQDAYLQIAKQAEDRAQKSQEAAIQQGDILKVGNRLWSVSKGKFVDTPRPDPMQALKGVLDSLSPAIRKGATARGHAFLEADPSDTKGALTEVMRYADEAQKEERQAAEKRVEKIQSSIDQERKWQEHRTELEGFERSMIPYRLQQKNLEPNADERRRADLAENMNENLTQLEEIVKRRPDLFGPHGAGLITSLRGMVGTSDPDVAALKAIHEYLGLASVGAHSMRSAQAASRAADAVMAGFRNSPEAMLHAINMARTSIATFEADTERMQRATEPGQSDPLRLNLGAPSGR